MNPYTPPKSSPAELGHAHAPRPISVWIFLLFLLTFTAIAILGVAQFLWGIALQPLHSRGFWLTVAVILLEFGLVAIMIGALFGIWNRRRWARWIGPTITLALAAYFILAKDNTYYATDAARSGGYLARFFVIPLLFSGWAYALAFTHKAKRYFSGPRNGA